MVDTNLPEITDQQIADAVALLSNAAKQKKLDGDKKDTM
jgi:hypothetical protein